MRDDTRVSISDSRTIEEMADCWKSRGLAVADAKTHEIEMSFDLPARRTVVAIEPKLMPEISQLARRRKVSAQTLIKFGCINR